MFEITMPLEGRGFESHPLRQTKCGVFRVVPPFVRGGTFLVGDYMQLNLDLDGIEFHFRVKTIEKALLKNGMLNGAKLI